MFKGLMLLFAVICLAFFFFGNWPDSRRISSASAATSCAVLRCRPDSASTYSRTEVFRIAYDLGVAHICDRIIDGRVEPLSLVIGPEEIARPLLDALRDGRAVLLVAEQCYESRAGATLH